MKMSRVVVVSFAMLLLSALVLDAMAFQYTLQAILPLSGNKSAQYRQWQSSAKLAASRVSAAWASSASPIISSDSLVVDFVDSHSDSVVAIHAAVAAMLNSSVMAVLTDADDASHAATILSTSSMPVITPDAEHSEFNTAGLGYYSMTPLDGASVNAFQALCSSYGWTKVGVAYIQTDTGTDRTYPFTLEAKTTRQFTVEFFLSRGGPGFAFALHFWSQCANFLCIVSPRVFPRPICALLCAYWHIWPRSSLV